MVLTKQELDQWLTYEPETGVFVWCVSRGKARAGSVAGRINNKGYRTIGIRGKCYQAHRLAWLLVYGEWPTKDLDHVNQIKDDNRIVNLRQATASENMQNRSLYANSSSGYRGVHWNKWASRWEARIRISGKLIHLGRFATKESAYAAYQIAAAKMHTHNPVATEGA